MLEEWQVKEAIGEAIETLDLYRLVDVYLYALNGVEATHENVVDYLSDPTWENS